MFFNNFFGCNNGCNNCKNKCERCERHCCRCCEQHREPIVVKPCCRCGGDEHRQCGCRHSCNDRRIECRCVCGNFNGGMRDDNY